MSERNHLLVAMLGAFVLLAAGGRLVVWPNMRETLAIRAEIDDLHVRIARRDQESRRLANLTRELDELRGQVRDELRVIPTEADVAGLIGRLSLPIDGRSVLDQTFTAGPATAAIPGVDDPEGATPVTVEVVASFESVFALVRIVETMNDLVRITAVRMAVDRDDDTEDPPALTAALSLEAISQAVNDGEGGP